MQLSFVVATADNTPVTIEPSANVAPGPDLPQGAHRGVPFTVILQKLQTFQFISSGTNPKVFEDLSGTRITSDQPIGVWSGHVCTTLFTEACDAVVEMLPPLNHWGTRFMSVPLLRDEYHPDVLRVLAAYDGTTVKVDGQLVKTLNAGEIYQLLCGHEQAHEIMASQPVLVAQYAASSGGDLSPGRSYGDPLMMLVPPVEEYMGSYFVSTAPRTVVDMVGPDPTYYSFANFLNLVARAEDTGSVLVDGLPITGGWRMIGHSEYASLQLRVSEGLHRITNLRPGARVGAWVYGWQSYSGYGAPAGMKLSQGTCVPTAPVAGDGVDNDCDGTIDEERADGLDNDGDGLKEEDLALAHTVNHAPYLSDSSAEIGPAWTNRIALLGSDPDGDPLTYRIVQPPQSGTVSLDGAVLVYTPAANYPQHATVLVVANDGTTDSRVATITLNLTNSTGCRSALPGEPNPCDNAPFFQGTDFGNSTVRVPLGGSATYRGVLVAQDFDAQAVHYNLVSGPTGFTVNTTTGAMSWPVTEVQIGSYTIQVQATDELGAWTRLSFTVVVQSASTNGAPLFTSSPVTQVADGGMYAYQAVAQDPEGDTVAYRLLDGPDTMKMSATGLLTWTPGEGDQGQQSIVIVATDQPGAQSAQVFTITVGQALLEFVSQPPLVAVVGQHYTYDAQIVDHTISGSPVVFSFSTDVAKPGMLMLAEIGQLVWTPQEADLGTHTVVITAMNSDGVIGKQHFVLQVSDFDVAPSITTQPVTSAVLGGLYFYDVDAEHYGLREQLSYSLREAPPGMVIDAIAGTIQWIPAYLGTEPITVRVTDTSGLYAEQTFGVQVSTDSTAPVVKVSATPGRMAAGSSSTISVQASDDVAVQSVSLTVNGTPLGLDASHSAVFTTTVPGLYTVVASATDTSGNTGTSTTYVGVAHGADTTPPALVLTAPTEDATLTYLHDVTGSLSDDNEVYNYTLSERFRGASTWNDLATGHGAVQAGVLGKLDTTLLLNGYHELRLQAQDVDGNSAELIRPFLVDGQAKVGPVQLSFVDAAIPVAGIPVTVM